MNPKRTPPRKQPDARNPVAPAADGYTKLVTLRDAGILTDQEFQAALGRLLASAPK